MLSALGLLVTLILGLTGWRIQLLGKRRAELAEEALLAFAHTADVLAFIRSPMSFIGQHEAMRKELGEPADKQLPNEEYRIVLWLMGKHRDHFAELRRLQLLCKFHFGAAAYNAFERLDGARHKVWGAAKLGAMAPEDNLPLTPENMKRRQEWQATVWAGAYEPDDIADAVNAAQQDIEAILTPHLRAEAALLPIAVGWRASKARAATLIRRNDRSVEDLAPSRSK